MQQSLDRDWPQLSSKSGHNPNPTNFSQGKPKSAASNETFEERVKSELRIESIQMELTASTYKDKFHNLICWEEKEHIDILGEK